MKRREALIDDNGTICCPKCGDALNPKCVEYGMADNGVHIYFEKRCNHGHGTYVYYTNALGTITYTRESVVHKLIIMKEDFSVINKKAVNKVTGDEVQIKAFDDGTFCVIGGDGQDGPTMTAKEFFKVYRLDDAEMTAATATVAASSKAKSKKAVADNGGAEIKTEPKAAKVKEPEVPEYDTLPTVFQNRAGKNCLRVDVKIDDVTTLHTLENTSGSIYFVELNRDMGEDETVEIAAKTKKENVVVGQTEDGKDIVEKQDIVVEPARTETRRKMLTIKSVKGSVEEVVKAYIGWLGYKEEDVAKEADAMAKRIRQSRKCLRSANAEVQEFYTK